MDRMLSMVKDELKGCTTELCDEIQQLRTQVADLEKKVVELQSQVQELSNPHLVASDASSDMRPTLSSAAHNQVTHETDNRQPSSSFVDVVKSSIQSALRDEKAKNDVIINAMPENQSDRDDVNTLCNKVRMVTKPCDVTRLGKPDKNHPRPIRATFPSQFDARAFLARIEEERKKNDGSLPSIRVRPCRTRDEQAKHAKVSKQVNKMNEDAKKAGNTESYSIRLNGEVWKFVKTESGRWERDSDWKFKPSIPDSGNEISTPEPHLAPSAPQEETD